MRIMAGLIIGFMVVTIPAWAEVVIDMGKVAHIESSGNPEAFNERSGCIGLFQINPKGALADYRAITGVAYTKEDLFDPTVNFMVADWYMNKRIPGMLKKYRKEDTIENRLWAYNCGIGCVIENRMPRETKRYIERYNKGV